MKYIISITAFILMSLGLYGQQQHQFTQFMFNKNYYNPAFAGARGVTSITGIYRNQWVGFDGAPISKMVSFDTPIFNQNAGLGVQVSNFNIGIMDSWGANLFYSYNIRFTDKISLRLGLGGSFNSLNIDFNDPSVIIGNPGDPSIMVGDDTQVFTGNFGIGGMLDFSGFYIGASAPTILENTIGEDNGQPTIAEFKRHYYGMMGASPQLSDRVSLWPTLLVSFVENAPIDFDFNLSFLFDDRFLVGSSYRHGGTGFAESIDFNLFYQIVPSFGIGAAYDLSIDQVAELGSGSIEFLARYDFGGGAGISGQGTGSGKTRLANPRYFF